MEGIFCKMSWFYEVSTIQTAVAGSPIFFAMKGYLFLKQPTLVN